MNPWEKSECFAFVAMTSKQVERYNFKLAVMTFIFLALSYFLAKAFGPIGFVLANCANFSMRISHNCWVINNRYREYAGDVPNPLLGIVPPAGTLLVLAVSGVVCKASEFYIYEQATILTFILHIAVGGVFFLATIAQILRSEPFLRDALVSFLKSRKLLKSD